MSDLVHHPAHYERGGIQPHVFIRSNDLSWCEGSIVEYLYRWDMKGGLQDLHKALQLLAWVIQDRLGQPMRSRPRGGVRPHEFIAANPFLGERERAIIEGVWLGRGLNGLSHLQDAQHNLNALIAAMEAKRARHA